METARPGPEPPPSSDAGDGRLENARAALRVNGDPGPLLALAELEAGGDAVGQTLVRHAGRVL